MSQQLVKKKKRGNQGKTPGSLPIVPSTALVYKGPTRLPARTGFSDDDQVAVQLNYIGTMSANGSGVLAPVLDSYSQASSSPSWASFAALYGEFRILSIDTIMVPWNKYNVPTTTTLAPVYIVEDRVNSTALSSLSDAAKYQNVEIYPPSSNIRKKMRMEGTGEASWTASGSTPASADRLYIKVYSAGNTSSVTLYDYCSAVMVQWRNRKI
jgi:hypothetical protein